MKNKENTCWMQTYTGKQFSPLQLDPGIIDIEDIAHALANICRFGGHCKKFYSVAQHSCLVLDEYMDSQTNAEGGRPSTAGMRWALIHDAAEAYIGDILRPLKNSLFAYAHQHDRHPKFESIKAVESHLQYEICNALGIPWDINSTIARDVQRADNVLLATEARDLMTDPPAPWEELPKPREEEILPWDPEHAKEYFLSRALGLGLIVKAGDFKEKNVEDVQA